MHPSGLMYCKNFMSALDLVCPGCAGRLFAHFVILRLNQVAQWLEFLLHDLEVVGSSPACNFIQTKDAEVGNDSSFTKCSALK